MSILHWDYNGTEFCEIRCACQPCAQGFIVEVGGSCFCPLCVNGHHEGCQMTTIMGVIK